jgi:hypothetical protein
MNRRAARSLDVRIISGVERFAGQGLVCGVVARQDPDRKVDRHLGRWGEAWTRRQLGGACRLVKAEIPKWAALAREAGVKPE